MGLKYNESWSTIMQTPVFSWIDLLIPGPNKYKHWGQIVLGDGSVSPEPNNLAGDEYCGGGNGSSSYGQPKAYGWGDATCSKEFPFMCRWGIRRALAPLPNWHLHTRSMHLPKAVASVVQIMGHCCSFVCCCRFACSVRCTCM
jgi:hypothetical protein